MSTALTTPAQDLRTVLHGKIDQLTDAELQVVQKQLEAMELRRRLDEICDEGGEEWRAGRMTQEMVDDAVRKFRSEHPYRTPGRP